MMEVAGPEFPQVVARDRSLGERSLSSVMKGSAVKERRCVERSEARESLSASLWLTSLQRPGVFEVVPTENISRSGMRMVAHECWKPEEQVLVSSPPGFSVQGSVVYCKKLPSDDYFLGISLDAPVENWTDTLWLGES